MVHTIGKNNIAIFRFSVIHSPIWKKNRDFHQINKLTQNDLQLLG